MVRFVGRTLTLVRCIATIIAVLTAATLGAKADLLDDLSGDTINSSLVRIDGIIASHLRSFDRKIDGYIQQFDRLVADYTLNWQRYGDVQRRLLTEDVFRLEKVVFNDLMKAIQELECVAIRTVSGTFPEAIEQAVEEIKKDISGFRALFFAPFSFAEPQEHHLSIDQLVHNNPDIVYYNVKSHMLSSIEKVYGPAIGSSSFEKSELPLYPYYSVLLRLSNLARTTSCMFPDSSADTRFYQEHLVLSRHAEAWDTVVRVIPVQQIR